LSITSLLIIDEQINKNIKQKKSMILFEY